jgi:signal transduction histidine kinase
MRTLLLLLFALSLAPRLAVAHLNGLAVLDDPAGTLDIAAVASADPGRFRALPSNSFAGGFTRGAFWFRFEVEGRGEHWLDILPPVLDDLRLYEADPAGTGGWHERRAGDTLPFAARELPYRGFVFQLEHEDDPPRTYYLRLQSVSSAAMTLRLWAPEAFITVSSLENALLLSAYGIIATIILLNLNTWFWMGDRLTLWFIAHLLALTAHFFGIDGHWQQYLIPDRPEWSFPFVTTAGFILIATANGFYRRLFGITREQPCLFWLYETNCWLPLLALPFALAGYFTEIMPVFMNISLLMIGVGVVLAFRLWRRGAAGGSMMLVANLIGLAGILVFVLNVLGRIEGGFFVWHSLLIASLGAIVALQVALGARTRHLRDAHLEAEQAAEHERGERIRQGQFLAMLAHELRTSLSVLKMAVGMQPMTPMALASAERAMNGMSEVIERSLVAQRIADGQCVPIPAPCDLAALIEAAAADSRAPERIRLSFGERPTLTTDARLLRVILDNLIDNALKYGTPDQPIDVALTANDARPAVRVCNAIGPAGPPDPARVFEKYYRAPAAHECTGSGLGLYIAYSLAGLMAGTLQYRPEPDRVCFDLRL